MKSLDLTLEFLEEAVQTTGTELLRNGQWARSRFDIDPKCGCLTVALAAKVSGEPVEKVISACPGGPRGALYLAILSQLDHRQVWALSDGYEGEPPHPEGPTDSLGNTTPFEEGMLPPEEFVHLFELGRAMAERHFGPLEAKA